MDIRLNDEQTMIRDTVRDIARDRIAPRAADIDRTGEFPWDVVDLFRKHDLFALPFPPEYGGLSGSALTLNVAIEEVAKVCATSALILAVQALGGYPLMIAGSDEQKARLLPDLATGAKLGAYALTEPGAGSDPAGMQTRAERHGDEYVITGSKIWITAGGIADTITVFAKTDRNERAKGVSAFVLEDAQHLKGFAANTIHGKLGIRGSNTAELQFDEVVVPAANRLGEEGEGFRIAMKVLDRSRPGVAAQALGIAQGALDYAVGYAKERKQFGKAIAEFQGIQFMVADMEAQTAAARAMVYWASQLIDDKSPEVGHFAAIAKLLAADTAMKVTTDAVQILGGYGYVNEYPVERMMRDAKITQIYEGTSQIQRVVIARDLLKACSTAAERPAATLHREDDLASCLPLAEEIEGGRRLLERVALPDDRRDGPGIDHRVERALRLDRKATARRRETHPTRRRRCRCCAAAPGSPARSGIRPSVKPTTMRRPSRRQAANALVETLAADGVEDRVHPETVVLGSQCRHPVAFGIEHTMCPGALGDVHLVGAGCNRDHLGAEPARHLDGSSADATSSSVDRDAITGTQSRPRERARNAPCGSS